VGATTGEVVARERPTGARSVQRYVAAALAIAIAGLISVALVRDRPTDGASTLPGGASGGPSPTPTAAGVPPGVPLSTRIGDIELSSAKATLQDVVVIGSIVVSAPDVTIRHVRVVPDRGDEWAIKQLATAGGLLVENSEVDGHGWTGDGITQQAPGLTVSYTQVHGVGVGIRLSSHALVKDSDIFAMVYGATTGGVRRGSLSQYEAC
jgi:hypothetical protein